MRFRYRYNPLQEAIIQRLHDTDVKFRIRADRSIDFAKKWYPDVDYEANEIRLKIFNRPLIRPWHEDRDISLMIHKLADMNIPFIIENHDGVDCIIYDDVDVEAVVQAENDLGLNIIE